MLWLMSKDDPVKLIIPPEKPHPGELSHSADHVILTVHNPPAPGEAKDGKEV